MINLTENDILLIDLLRNNARMRITDIAKTLGISRTTAQQRLSRLEDNGVIEGYQIKLAPTVLEKQVSAHVSIGILPNYNETVHSQLSNITEIVTLFSVSGRVDLLAVIQVSSTSRLDEVLDQISKVKGVKSTESAIILKTKFDRR
jgi:DNA-binding Lrp family transcriptional regulator